MMIVGIAEIFELCEMNRAPHLRFVLLAIDEFVHIAGGEVLRKSADQLSSVPLTRRVISSGCSSVGNGDGLLEPMQSSYQQAHAALELIGGNPGFLGPGGGPGGDLSGTFYRPFDPLTQGGRDAFGVEDDERHGSVR
jgi:hypothetical protein